MARVSGLAGLHYVGARSGGPGAAIVQKTALSLPPAPPRCSPVRCCHHHRSGCRQRLSVWHWRQL